MTTPDIAGQCERLRSSAAAFREHTVYDSEGDPLRLIAQADEADKAADTLERQAAEIERLRGVVSLVSDIFTDMIRNGYVYSGEEPAPFGAYYIGPGALEKIFARAALTGEDPGGTG
jgi:hypothetical protein